ncbi:MAG: hypothetical protein ACI8R1_002233, partial [Psychrobacter glaciei]
MTVSDLRSLFALPFYVLLSSRMIAMVHHDGC